MIPKTESLKSKIRARLLQSFMFNHLDEQSLEVVINAMDQKFYQPGDSVITQGESGHELYVVENGNLSCWKIFVRFRILKTL